MREKPLSSVFLTKADHEALRVQSPPGRWIAIDEIQGLKVLQGKGVSTGLFGACKEGNHSSWLAPGESVECPVKFSIPDGTTPRRLVWDNSLFFDLEPVAP